MLDKLPQPIPPVLIIRVLVVLVVLLAFLSGYYFSALEVEQQKSEQLQLQLEQGL